MAMRDDVQQALTLLREELLGRQRGAVEDLRASGVPESAPASPAEITPERILTHAGNALQEEWAQLLDLGLASLHAESDPNAERLAVLCHRVLASSSCRGYARSLLESWQACRQTWHR